MFAMFLSLNEKHSFAVSIKFSGKCKHCEVIHFLNFFPFKNGGCTFSQRARSLVVSDLSSETKGSRFESGC